MLHVEAVLEVMCLFSLNSLEITGAFYSMHATFPYPFQINQKLEIVMIQRRNQEFRKSHQLILLPKRSLFGILLQQQRILDPSAYSVKVDSAEFTKAGWSRDKYVRFLMNQITKLLH